MLLSYKDDMTLADGFRSEIDFEIEMTGADGFNLVVLNVYKDHRPHHLSSFHVLDATISNLLMSLQSVNATYAPRRDSVDVQNELIKIPLSVIWSYLISMLILKKERVICNGNERLEEAVS